MANSKIHPLVFLIGGVPMIDPAKLKEIASYNVRDAFDPIGDTEDRDLVASIRANGFMTDQGVTTRFVGPDAYVISGHRRKAAVDYINATDETKIRAIAIRPEGQGEKGERSLPEMALDLIVSNSGKPLSPMERGAVYLRLKSYGWTVPQIAEKCATTDKWVRELCKMAALDPRVKALVKAGVVSPTLAAETAAKHGKKTADVIKAAAQLGTGANVGKATGKTIGAVTGTTPKNAKAPMPLMDAAGGKVDRLVQNAAKHADTAQDIKARGPVPPLLAPVKPGTIVPGSSVAGPFRLGTGLDDCDLLTKDGALLCAFPDVKTAKFMLTVVNMGWAAWSGKGAPEASDAPKATPAHVQAAKANDTRKSAQAAKSGHVARKSGK